MSLILIGIDGRMYGEDDFSRFEVVGGAGHHGEGSVDGEGYHGERKLYGQLEGSAFEGTHGTGPGAGSLGEYDERHAALQGGFGLLQGLFHTAGGGVVDKDMAGGGAGAPHEGDVAQALFHHPLEIVVEVAVDEKYVVGSLVVGHEYIGGIFVDVFAPAYFDTYQREDAEEPRPDVGGVVAPDVAFAQAAPDEGDDGGEQGEYEQDRHGDEPLV